MVFEGVNFSDMIKQLEQMGFYEVILPFMLVFTIMFALLQKIKLFGADTKNINIVVAAVIAFFFVRVPAIIATVNQFLPKISMIVIVLLMFLLILGVLGSGESTGWTGWPFFIGMAGAVIGIIWAVATSVPGLSTSWPRWLVLSSQDKAILLAVGIFVLLIWVFSDKKADNDKFKVTKEFGPSSFGFKGGK
ncbi:MAG: hypothetical protein PHO02_01410 [Candidatus Nanoarchaeia archaeon]|nr:hypothetical protein [Candidatus Nanoarchaeia archaeon]